MRRRLSTAACRVLVIGIALTTATSIGWHLRHKGVIEQTRLQHSIALANAVQARLDGQAQILRAAALYFARSRTPADTQRRLPPPALHAFSDQPGWRQIGLLGRVSDPQQTTYAAELGTHALIAADDSAPSLRVELLATKAGSANIDDPIASLPDQPAIAAALDFALAHNTVSMTAPLVPNRGAAGSTRIVLIAPVAGQLVANPTATAST
ncbi:MAG: hypothetical protein M3N23_10555, partial [Pseudomonadota bacterium]|nr:hypothetical protein [Pseudomonadota bacterium]